MIKRFISDLRKYDFDTTVTGHCSIYAFLHKDTFPLGTLVRVVVWLNKKSEIIKVLTMFIFLWFKSYILTL